MAGIAALIVKVMPSSPDVNLVELEEEALELLEKEGAQNISFTEEPVAFGLKAVMIKMAWPEDKETELVVECLNSIEEVSAVDIVDYRRAFG